MAIFAQLDENNIVLRVIAVGDDVQTSNGPLSNNPKHVDGENYCLIFGKGPWKQGFEDGTRKQYPSIGFTYDSINDVFIQPRPFQSWTLDSNYDWQPPITKPDSPDDNLYSIRWDEDTLNWIAYGENNNLTWNSELSIWE